MAVVIEAGLVERQELPVASALHHRQNTLGTELPAQPRTSCISSMALLGENA